jgi:hypothetical protein
VLVEHELKQAHHQLMWEAFRAAEIHPIGHQEIRQAKDILAAIKRNAETLAQEIEDMDNDPQLVGMWRVFKVNRQDDKYLSRLPDDLSSLTTALAHTFYLIADFFQEASKHYKPEGPAPLVGHTRSRNASKTTVIRRIARTCQKHFGVTLNTTVATLANASLDRNDIKRDTVKGSLRSTRRGGD